MTEYERGCFIRLMVCLLLVAGGYYFLSSRGNTREAKVAEEKAANTRAIANENSLRYSDLQQTYNAVPFSPDSFSFTIDVQRWIAEQTRPAIVHIDHVSDMFLSGKTLIVRFIPKTDQRFSSDQFAVPYYQLACDSEVVSRLIAADAADEFSHYFGEALLVVEFTKCIPVPFHVDATLEDGDAAVEMKENRGSILIGNLIDYRKIR